MEKLRAKFTGDGREYHSGIPARDLAEQDWERLTPEQRDTVRRSPLYDARTNAEMQPKAAPTRRSAARRTPAHAAPEPSAPEPAAEEQETPAAEAGTEGGEP